MELQDRYPQWKVLPQFAQLLLDHRDDQDAYQDELQRLAYWVVYEHFDRQVLTNEGALDRNKQLAVVEQITKLVCAAGDETLNERTWVLLTEAKKAAGACGVMLTRMKN